MEKDWGGGSAYQPGVMPRGQPRPSQSGAGMACSLVAGSP